MADIVKFLGPRPQPRLDLTMHCRGVGYVRWFDGLEFNMRQYGVNTVGP